MKGIKEAKNVLHKDHPSSYHDTVWTYSVVSLKILSLLGAQGPFLAISLSLATFSVTLHRETDTGGPYWFSLQREEIYLLMVPMTQVLLFDQQLSPMSEEAAFPQTV